MWCGFDLHSLVYSVICDVKIGYFNFFIFIEWASVWLLFNAKSAIFIRPSLRRDILWYTNVHPSVTHVVLTPWPIHFKFHRVIVIDGLTVCILFGEISIFHSRVMGLYSSNCRRFFVCRTVNWEPLGQFTSNFAQLLELIVLPTFLYVITPVTGSCFESMSIYVVVYFLVKFRFFIQELWERKSLQILYECWRRVFMRSWRSCLFSYTMARTS
jgi:hypothetical protein